MKQKVVDGVLVALTAADEADVAARVTAHKAAAAGAAESAAAVTREEAEILAGLAKLAEYAAVERPTVEQSAAMIPLLARAVAVIAKRLQIEEAT